MESWLDELMEDLRDSAAISLSFKKVDGTDRVMRCTLNPRVIPEDAMPKHESKAPAEKESKTIVVYDLDEEGWRSFRKDNVIQWFVLSDND